MLCLAFYKTQFSIYFSKKLKNIIAKAGKYGDLYKEHALIWLLMASQISQDRDSYEFARDQLNSKGGVSLETIIQPTVSCPLEKGEESNKQATMSILLIPPYTEWKALLSQRLSPMGVNDILPSIIEGFLVMKQWEKARSKFATICLNYSIKQYLD